MREGILQCSVNLFTLRKCLQHILVAEPKLSWDFGSAPCALSAAQQKPSRQVPEEEISLEVLWPFAVKPAVCKAGRVLRSLMAMFYFAKWEGWSTWRGQVLVLLQNLLHNKSAATDFPASSPLCAQAARKNRRCYISVQNQRRKLNSTQRRIFAGCTKSDFTGKEARLPEQHTGIHKNLNHYEAEGGEWKAQNNIYHLSSLHRKLNLLEVSVKQFLSSAITTWHSGDTDPSTTPKAKTQWHHHL